MYALKVEYTDSNLTRLLIIEISEDTYNASIADIIEADEENIPALVQYLQDSYPDANAVLVDKNQEGAQPIGNHFVCIPDEIGVFELAEILAKDDRRIAHTSNIGE